MTDIELFIENLDSQNELQYVTNLYSGNSHENLIRKNNLKLYLEKMKMLKPKFLLLGEAPGYKGCRLTGIPFTSERILDNNTFFKQQGFKCLNNSQNLESEISATIIWNELEKFKEKPLIWNIFPFHPHQPNENKTNRTPNKKELKLGKEYLIQFLKLFSIEKIIALGRKPETQISDLGLKYAYVRHPANGGKLKFIAGLKNEMK